MNEAVRFIRIGFNTQPPKGGWCEPYKFILRPSPKSFNTQPPKGGWLLNLQGQNTLFSFNTQPPKGGWNPKPRRHAAQSGFNTQPPKGGWRVGIG